MITQTIDLNLVPGSVCPVIHLNQFDKYTNGLKFNLYQDAAFTIPSGSSVTIRGTKPDGYGFDYTAASWSGNTATFNVTEQMTAVDGDVPCELRVVNGTKLIGTQNFILAIERAPLNDDTVISDSDIPAIAAAADYAAEAASSAAQAASTVSSTVKYSDIYNGLDYSGTAQKKPLDALQGALLQSQGRKLGGVIAIAENTNLNSITTFGEYQFDSTVAATLVNCPISYGGRLIVECGIILASSTNFYRQTIIRYNTADNIFTRVTWNGGSSWTNWYKYEMTDTGA